MTGHEKEDIMFLLQNATPEETAQLIFYLPQERTVSFPPPVPFPLSSEKTGWFFSMMLLKRSPLPALILDFMQQHSSAQKEALKGKYHGAGMPYFPEG